MGSRARDSQRRARDDHAELGRDSAPDVELRRYRAQRPAPRARAAAHPDGQGRDPQLLLGPSARRRHDRVAQPGKGRRAGRAIRDEPARVARPALQYRSSRNGRPRLDSSDGATEAISVTLTTGALATGGRASDRVAPREPGSGFSKSRAARAPLLFTRSQAPRAERPTHSGMVSPEPPNSFGKSFCLGRPSRIGNTVSA